jgi:dipeptidyl aminopeptidase/acylaminoacyl peptidase
MTFTVAAPAAAARRGRVSQHTQEVSMSRHLFAVLTLALTAVAPLPAQERPSDTLLTVQHYLDFEQVSDPQISPDGSRIVYTRRWVNRQEDRWDSALWIMNADGSQQRFLVRGSGARWSPDGTRILYLADGEPRGTQIFVRWMDAEGATSQVTRVEKAPADPRWSPDGRRIAFTMLVPRPARWEIPMPAAPQGANWTPAPRIVERLHFRQDRVGFMENGFTHLFVVPAEGGTPRQLTEGDWNVGARFDALSSPVTFDWTPDGRTIVIEGLNAPDNDFRYRDSDILALDVETRAVRRLTTRRGNWQDPSVSPDGRLIAYAGHDSTDFSYQTSALWVMSADGSGARALTAELDRSPQDITWAPDGSGLYFTAQDRGTQNVYFVPLRGGGARRLTEGTHMLSLSSLARLSPTLVAVGARSDFDEPNDIVRYNLRAPQTVTRLTSVNADILDRIRLGQVEEIWYNSTGNTRVQGWIVKPPGFDPTQRYPLIMEIHGGPHAMYNVGFSYMFQNFAANGYVVLYTNPRGSSGYGTGFGNAIMRAYPSVDYDDLMAGVDEVISRGYVDTTRMYVGGCSGGGVLSSWVIGHTRRFAAAAVRCPVINWMSFLGQTDVPLFTMNFFPRPFWEDPQPWLRQSSLMYAGNVRTPTLLMTGELDLRTPIDQTDEFYVALKLRGVPVTMLRFNGEYHGTSSKPSNFVRTLLYMQSWYQRWRQGGQAQQAVGQ